MKTEIRLLGVDDAPFSFKDNETFVIGVVMRGGVYIEGVLSRKISIDGLDSTDICIDMILKTRHKKQLKAMLLDGVSLGGFNIIDIEKVFDETEIPVITVTRDKPDFDKIKSALKKYFSDWKQRFNIITRGTLHIIETSYNPIYVKCAGISINEAKKIIKISTIRGVIPEPIRVAHLIASGIKKGESYGKA